MDNLTVGAIRIFEDPNEVFDQAQDSRRCSFSGDLGSLIWLLKCGITICKKILYEESFKVVADQQEGDSCMLARVVGPRSVFTIFHIPDMLRITALLSGSSDWFHLSCVRCELLVGIIKEKCSRQAYGVAESVVLLYGLWLSYLEPLAT